MNKVSESRKLKDIVEKSLEATKIAVTKQIVSLNSLNTTELWASDEALLDHRKHIT